MSIYYPRIGEWVCGYGGRMNHLVAGHGKEDSITHLSKVLFACGKSSDFVQWGYNGMKGKCTKCETIQAKNNVIGV